MVNVKDNVIFFFFLSNRVMIQQLLERFYMNKLPDNNETLEQRTVCYMYTLLVRYSFERHRCCVRSGVVQAARRSELSPRRGAQRARPGSRGPATWASRSSCQGRCKLVGPLLIDDTRPSSG